MIFVGNIPWVHIQNQNIFLSCSRSLVKWNLWSSTCWTVLWNTSNIPADLQVALVSGISGGKCSQNIQRYQTWTFLKILKSYAVNTRIDYLSSFFYLGKVTKLTRQLEVMKFSAWIHWQIHLGFMCVPVE